MEWQVLSRNCSHTIECKIPVETSEHVLQTLLRVETKWLTNIKVLKQVITNYIVLADIGLS